MQKRKSVGRLAPGRVVAPSALIACAVAGAMVSVAHAANYTFDPGLTNAGTSDGPGPWDTATANWYDGTSDIIWPNVGDTALFGSGGAGGAVTVQAGGVNVNAITFNSSGYSLNGGPISLVGTSPTITNNVDGAISSALAGTTAAGSNALIKAGSGNLTLTGAETYTGNTVVNAGTLTYGTGSSSTASAAIDVGTVANQSALLNIDTAGALTFSTTLNVGDIGSAGAVTQTNGSVSSVLSGGNYITIGNDGYGSYVLSGGSLTAGSSGNLQGIRVGGNQNGLTSNGVASVGILTQTGGSLSSYRYLAIGTGTGTGSAASTGIATFTGGTQMIVSGYRVNIGDGANATGVMNLGTEAGGNAIFTTGTNTEGIAMRSNTSIAGSTLNVDSGTLIFPATAGIQQPNAGSAVVNLDGGVLQTGAAIPIISAQNSLPVYVYNGGAVFNVSSAGVSATVPASLQAAAGNGIYVPGGIIPVGTLAGNSGYIGAPVVTISGGAGTGATAIANVVNGSITGVTITSPGQNYVAGNPVTFTFSGGTGSAVAFTTSVDSDLAANNGGLTNTGPGTLVLSGSNSYTGPTTLDAGVLKLGASNRINDGSPLVLNGGEFSTGGFSDTLGTLDVAVSSEIDFGVGNTGSILDFADSSAISWSGTLTIADWSGLYTGGGTDQLFVGSDSSALTPAQLADIDFTGYNPGATILADGEVVPVPEPVSVSLLGFGALALLGRRRRVCIR